MLFYYKDEVSNKIEIAKRRNKIAQRQRDSERKRTKRNAEKTGKKQLQRCATQFFKGAKCGQYKMYYKHHT